MKKKELKFQTVLPYAAGLLAFILALVFIFMPVPAAGLSIRFYFKDFTESSLKVYYTTDSNPNMGEEQTINLAYDAENRFATLKFSPELAEHLDMIRLDFPTGENLLSFVNISVSSAGVIQHQYDPCRFFSDDHLLIRNDIPQISLAESTRTAYVKTSGSDPYLIFSAELVQELLQYRSTYRLTRLVACLLIALGYASYRFRPFGAGVEAL